MTVSDLLCQPKCLDNAIHLPAPICLCVRRLELGHATKILRV